MGVGRRDWIAETIARPERRIGIRVRDFVGIVRGVKVAPMGVSSYVGRSVSLRSSVWVGSSDENDVF